MTMLRWIPVGDWRWRLLAWTGALAVLAICLMPGPYIAVDAPANTDKLVHATMYAVLCYLYHMAYPKWSLAVLGLGLAAYGVGIECLQMATPTRFGSVLDAVANCTGISIMLLSFKIRDRTRQIRTANEPGP